MFKRYLKLIIPIIIIVVVLSVVLMVSVKKSPDASNIQSLDAIEAKLKQFLKEQNISVEFKKKDGALVLEHNIVPRQVIGRSMTREPGPTMERMVPADDGFRVQIWRTAFSSENVDQAVRPQELREYGPSELLYTIYLGTSNPFPKEGEKTIQYNIEYGTKIKKEFVGEVGKLILESDTKSIEFAKVKAKTHTYEEIPNFLKDKLKATKNETLPERGLIYYSDIFGSNNGEFIVDIDKKTFKYWVKEWPDINKTGVVKLSDSQVNEIVSIVNKIWASQSDFESTQINARASLWNLVLVDKGVYRWFEFGGIPSEEAGQLTSYLEDLVTNVSPEEPNLIPKKFPFFKKTKIFIQAVTSPNSGYDTQGAIDSETGLERWQYVAVKESEEIEIGSLYSVRKDGITETHAEKFNALIREEKISLNKTQAKDFAAMVLNLSFSSVYNSGEVKNVIEEKGYFRATARLKQIIGMVPYHDESDLEFSFNKDGTLIEFSKTEWKRVEGHS